MITSKNEGTYYYKRRFYDTADIAGQINLKVDQDTGKLTLNEEARYLLNGNNSEKETIMKFPFFGCILNASVSDKKLNDENKIRFYHQSGALICEIDFANNKMQTFMAGAEFEWDISKDINDFINPQP